MTMKAVVGSPAAVETGLVSFPGLLNFCMSVMSCLFLQFPSLTVVELSHHICVTHFARGAEAGGAEDGSGQFPVSALVVYVCDVLPVGDICFDDSVAPHSCVDTSLGAEAGGGGAGADGDAAVSITVEAQNNPVRAAISSTLIVESTYRSDVQDGIDFRVKLKADGPTGWRADAKTLMNLRCNVGSVARFRKLRVLKVLRCFGNRAVIEVDRAEYDLKSKVLRTKGLPGMVGKTAVNISASFTGAAARAGVRVCIARGRQRCTVRHANPVMSTRYTE